MNSRVFIDVEPVRAVTGPTSFLRSVVAQAARLCAFADATGEPPVLRPNANGLVVQNEFPRVHRCRTRQGSDRADVVFAFGRSTGGSPVCFCRCHRRAACATTERKRLSGSE